MHVDQHEATSRLREDVDAVQLRDGVAQRMFGGGCSGGGGLVGRVRRSRSRQALTTIRCSHVVTADSPRKDPALRYAAMKASWTQSEASSGSPQVRTATAHIRSLWRLKISAKASRSPAQCAASNSASERPANSTRPEVTG